MGNREKRRAKIEAARRQRELSDAQEAQAFKNIIIDEKVADIPSTPISESQTAHLSPRIIDVGDVIEMKCVIPNTGIVPCNIVYGSSYYRDKNAEFHGNVLGSAYGLFFYDSLLTDYAGIKELSFMEEV